MIDFLDSIPNETKVGLINECIKKIKFFHNKVRIKETFSIYLERNYERLSVMKTLLYRTKPVKLSEIYVRSSLSINKGEGIDDNKVSSFILDNKRVVISGIAGLGKSVLCKSIFLEMVNKACGVYPVFIELRELKNYLDLSFLEYICKEISSVNNNITIRHLEQLIEKGNILLILDGFDEIDFDIRDRYTREILELSRKYKNIHLLISSRPDECFSSWTGFYELFINPLNKDQAIELIKKLNYDNGVKTKFIQKINNELYDTHTSFIGNPLLLTMMLMTFQEFAEIPKKIHLFYEQAFQTLFLKHDSLKESYSRKTKSGMDINEFKKVFSYFCLETHVNKQINFKEEKAKSILDKAIKHFNKNSIKSNDILYDLMNNLCVIHKDGLSLTFTHRSFQEYFTALYIKDCPYLDRIYRLIDKVVLSNQSNICRMLYDMNPNLLENMWIKPKIEELLSNDEASDMQQKEYKVKEVISYIYIIDGSRSNDKLPRVSYFPSGNINGYNYISFNNILHDNYSSDIRFDENEIISILPSNYFRPIGKIKDIISELKDGEMLEDAINLDSLKSNLEYNSFYKLIDFIYNDLFLNRKKALKKINEYIDGKKIENEFDLDSLLNS